MRRRSSYRLFKLCQRAGTEQKKSPASLVVLSSDLPLELTHPEMPATVTVDGWGMWVAFELGVSLQRAAQYREELMLFTSLLP